MEKHTYAAITSLLLVVSGSKTKEPIATVKNEVDVKADNTTTWHSTTNKMETVVGATINLISDSANRGSRINSNDNVQGNFLRFEYNYKDVNRDSMIDAKDVVNGSLMKTDTLVKVKVFIGE